MENGILADRLCELRAQKGVTQDAVALALGVSNKAVSKWETGTAIPEAQSLPGIADYYGVSIDSLFGRDASGSTVKDVIVRDYDTLCREDRVLRSYELSLAVIRSCEPSACAPEGGRGTPSVPPRLLLPKCTRVGFSGAYAYELFVNSDENNLSVILLPNKSNFRWLTEKSEDYLPLLRFLCEPGAAELIALMHDASFPLDFTADFIAAKAGIDDAKARLLLDSAVPLKLISARTAHLNEGEVTLYHAEGNGIVLSILSLAYELVCGTNSYDYYSYEPAKMIYRGNNR